MAKPKQVPSGRWALSLHHPSLPGGRKYFTFETEAEAVAYQQQWQLMRMSDLALPAELTSSTPGKDVRISRILADWEHSGYAAKTQELTLRTVARELGSMKLSELNYRTLNDYLRALKIKQNLSPCSIKHRMQALSRALDEYARNHPKMEVSNPVKMLPRGYSTYNDVDSKLVVEAGGKPKKSEWRDRRLKPGEQEKILSVMSGDVKLYKSRGLSLKGGDALRVMFLLIVNTGLRLSEAFLLKRALLHNSSLRRTTPTPAVAMPRPPSEDGPVQ